MTGTEALAALLHAEFITHEMGKGREDDPCSLCDQRAARLIAAGVTLTPADAPSDLRAALKDAIRILSGGHRGYVGDHYIREVQVNEATIERLRAALSGDRADATPADAPSDLRAWWDGLTDDERWDAFVIEKSNADALSGPRPSPEADPHKCCGECEYEEHASPATAPAEGLNVERLAAAMHLSPYRFGAGADERTDPGARKAARWLAAEYARLAPDSAQVAKLSSSAGAPSWMENDTTDMAVYMDDALAAIDAIGAGEETQ